jgi:hypothetical protein
LSSATEEVPARIHILPAREKPVAVILRRKPSKCFHVMKWNTLTDEIEHGSWFRGKLYSLRCDVSFDGEWMVYLAMGATADTWNGICRPPWLKTVVDGENMGAWFGGGYWAEPEKLMLNGWELPKLPKGERSELPFKTAPYRPSWGEDEGVLFARLERDGWRRAGELGREYQVPGTKRFLIVCENDPGWTSQPTERHPVLRMVYRGYLHRGRTYGFHIEGDPERLGPGVEWATWDRAGQLLVARAGGVERYTLQAMTSGGPPTRIDFEELRPPPVPPRPSQRAGA